MEHYGTRKYLTVIFLMAGGLFMGCGTVGTAKENLIYVGVASYDQSDVFISELIQCLRDEVSQQSEKADVMITVRDAAGSQKMQNDQIKEMIDEGCNILCVNLVDRTDPSEIIERAREKDIPIIFFNREPVAEDLMRWDKLYYVGAKALQSGELQGELTVKAVADDPSIDRNQDGVLRYVILEGEMGHQDAIVRTESVVEYIRSKGLQLEKLSYEIANWKRGQAQNRMEQLIKKYGDSIELVLSNNDDMALGALDTYQKLGYTNNDLPAILGIDGIRDGLEAVREFRMVATVYNDKEGQAKAMADIIFASMLGGTLEELYFEDTNRIYLPYQKVTAENVDAYLEEDPIWERE